MRNWMKLALVSGAATAMAAPAMAGSTGYGGCSASYIDGCAPDVVVHDSQPYADDMLVSIDQPMGHLRSIQLRHNPHVSITRVHGMGDTAGLSDHPGAFHGGCNVGTSSVCGPVAAPLSAPVGPAPILAAPIVSAPFVAAPVMAAPVAQTGLRRWTASYNDDPTRFTPRQYGSLDFVPGVAHVPSSWVDRDPNRAQAALNASGAGGVAPGPQVGLVRIPDNTPGPIIPPGQFQGPAPVQPGSIVQPGPASTAPERHVITRGFAFGAPASPLMAYSHPAPIAPVRSAPRLPVLQAPVVQGSALQGPAHQGPAYHGAVAGVAPSGTVVPNLSPNGYPVRPSAPVLTASGHYASQVAGDGTYWEKVSGPTMMGDTVATQVICKRQLRTEVVNPVVGVPVPVPVDGCPPGPHAAHAQPLNSQPMMAPQPRMAPQPPLHTSGLAGGHWTY